MPLLLCVTIMLSACGGDTAGNETSGDSGGDGPREKEEVTLLLSFLHGVINAHYYLAEDLGYFDRCGFDVELLPALEIDNPLSVMLADRVDYAVIDPLQAVAGIDQGLPIDVIQADLARTPVSYVSLAENGIEAPEDFPGKVVGVVPGGDSEWFLELVMENLSDEERDQVKVVTIGYDITALLAGKIDVQSIFPTDPIFATMQVEGTDFNVFRASDYGIETHGNVLVTPSETVDQDPESVTRFLAAITAGMEASLDMANAERAVELTQEYIAEEGVQDVLKTEVGLHLYELIQAFRQDPLWDEHGLGWNEAEAHAEAQDILVKFGQVEESAARDPEELFNNEILETLFADGPELDLDAICG